MLLFKGESYVLSKEVALLVARIDEYHRYHGAALSQVAEHPDFSSVNKVVGMDSRSVYQINHNIGMYVKHSTLENNEWRFTFAPTHQEEVRQLFVRFPDRTFVVLVCGDEICCLTYGEYAACIDENFDESEWLEIWRPEGGRFRVRGACGELPRKIPLNRFPGFLFDQ